VKIGKVTSSEQVDIANVQH